MADRLTEARAILVELGLPKKQQNRISGLVLMALCQMTPTSKWSSARAESLTVRKGIMDYVRDVLGVTYKENSREQFRRNVLHQFIQAGVVAWNPDAPGTSINSQKNHYRITKEALQAIRTFRTPRWKRARAAFLAKRGALVKKYAAPRNHKMVPVRLPNGWRLKLSPGSHNLLQAAIVEAFTPRFAPGARLLYLGDAAKKALYIDARRLSVMKISLTEHDKLTDVMLYDARRKWLYLVEAVSSHGPMSPKRVLELKEKLADSSVGLIYVSAFANIREFKRYAQDIAWDTEVWLADMPDHLMHFNGDRFLGPRN